MSQVQRVTYTIQYMNGYFLPKRGNNTITESDVEDMIAGLQNTLERMRSGESISEVATCETQVLFDDIMAKSEWLFNDDANAYCYWQNTKNPQYSGGCVYFMISRGQNHRIKIGCSHDLYYRTKEHHEGNEGHQPRIIALCRTAHYLQFERLLHNKFADHHVGRKDHEWFAFEPVRYWLCEVMAAVQS